MLCAYIEKEMEGCGFLQGKTFLSEMLILTSKVSDIWGFGTVPFV